VTSLLLLLLLLKAEDGPVTLQLLFKILITDREFQTLLVSL
jgi:hypothetical protein